MNEHYLRAAETAFLNVWQDWVLKYHPEQNTPLNRDLARSEFTRCLGHATTSLDPMRDVPISDRASVQARLLKAFSMRYRLLRKTKEFDHFVHSFEDDIRKALQPSLY